ncbi:MAG: CPBP family intramembrane metalloprotease [Prevotella sp.]|nr:CPBP family intramembrane metalloprotease [Prevotella sp.]
MKRKSLLRMAGEVIWYMVVFLLIQVIVQGIASVVEAYLAEGDLKSTFANGLANADNIGITALIISNVVSSLLTIIIFLKAKWTLWARDYLATRPWGVVFWVIILSFGLIIPTMWLQEELHLEMPKEMEELFTSVCSTPYGYFTLAVLAPWAEEVVFRGAILRKLLEIFSHQMHWVAIVISAIIFGAVHMNMAQGVNAFVLGLLLGWMFYRTGSIFPGIVLHWANNTIAYILVRLRPDLSDASLTDICGGDENKVLLYVGFSMLIVIPAIFQLFIRMKKPQKRN